MVDDARLPTRAGAIADAEDARDSLWNQRRIHQRSQLHEPGAAWMPVEDFGSQLKREPGLAAAPRARQGQEAGVADQFLQLFELSPPADEIRQFLWQVVPVRSGGSWLASFGPFHVQVEPVSATGNRAD